MADCATKEDQCHPRKIFVGGLTHKLSTQGLRDHFSRFGAIVDAVVLRWPDGRSRGFGYVTFADVASAAAAIEETHEIGGREVDVKRAVPGTNKLFVGGLPQSVSAAELREHFEFFGVVSDAVVMIDPATNRSRGFGFICFLPGPEGSAAVDMALSQYEHHRVRGKWIEVKSAAPPHKLMGKEGQDATPSTGVPDEACTPDAVWMAAPIAPTLSTPAPGPASMRPTTQEATWARQPRAAPTLATAPAPGLLPHRERPFAGELAAGSRPPTPPGLQAAAGWAHCSQWPPSAAPLQRGAWATTAPALEEAEPAWMRPLQPQVGGAGPLPSLLTSGGDSPCKLNSPMKVRVRAHATWPAAERFAPPEQSEASNELQRSLEELRQQAEPSHVRVEDTATSFDDDALGFFMEDNLVETKLER